MCHNSMAEISSSYRGILFINIVCSLKHTLDTCPLNGDSGQARRIPYLADILQKTKFQKVNQTSTAVSVRIYSYSVTTSKPHTIISKVLCGWIQTWVLKQIENIVDLD